MAYGTACGRLPQKINVNNTWNMALIDYFHDLSLVRDGDSINFQKASCTLEGCVKVYSSRVESVSSETAKLLSGLASAIADSGTHQRCWVQATYLHNSSRGGAQWLTPSLRGRRVRYTRTWSLVCRG